MKKILSVFLIISIALFSVISSSAAAPELSSIGTIVSETGKSLPVQGRLTKQELIATPTEFGVLDFQSANTYEYYIAVPRSNETTTVDDYDSSISVHGFLTIVCSTQESSGLTAYLLTRVSGSYNITDESVSVTSSKVSYGCTSMIDPESLDQSVSNRSVANPFSIDTGFSVYAPLTHSGDQGSCGASYSMNLRRGTSSNWTFTLDNHI